MDTYIILFRGMNVGGHNIVPMAALKSLLENAGYEAVRTYIQSGNVVLKAASDPQQDIAERVQETFAFKPDLVVLKQAEFTRLVAQNPYQSADGKTVHFYFCTAEPVPDYARADARKAADEAYQLQGKVLYLSAPSGIGRSKLVADMEKCLGVAATGRNLNTVLKLQALAEAG